jgi:hypothetical protein
LISITLVAEVSLNEKERKRDTIHYQQYGSPKQRITPSASKFVTSEIEAPDLHAADQASWNEK